MSSKWRAKLIEMLRDKDDGVELFIDSEGVVREGRRVQRLQDVPVPLSIPKVVPLPPQQGKHSYAKGFFKALFGRISQPPIREQVVDSGHRPNLLSMLKVLSTKKKTNRRTEANPYPLDHEYAFQITAEEDHNDHKQERHITSPLPFGYTHPPRTHTDAMDDRIHGSNSDARSSNGSMKRVGRSSAGTAGTEWDPGELSGRTRSSSGCRRGRALQSRRFDSDEDGDGFTDLPLTFPDILPPYPVQESFHKSTSELIGHPEYYYTSPASSAKSAGRKDAAFQGGWQPAGLQKKPNRKWSSSTSQLSNLSSTAVSDSDLSPVEVPRIQVNRPGRYAPRSHLQALSPTGSSSSNPPPYPYTSPRVVSTVRDVRQEECSTDSSSESSSESDGIAVPAVLEEKSDKEGEHSPIPSSNSKMDSEKKKKILEKLKKWEWNQEGTGQAAGESHDVWSSSEDD